MNAGTLSHLFQEELYYFTTPVAVVLPRPWNTCGEEEQVLLKRILNSVKVDFNAVRLLSLPSFSLATLKIYSPARVLIFGCDTEEDIPLYQSTTAQGFLVVKADDLKTLDEVKKKNLWTALRHLFGMH